MALQINTWWDEISIFPAILSLSHSYTSPHLLPPNKTVTSQPLCHSLCVLKSHGGSLNDLCAVAALTYLWCISVLHISHWADRKRYTFTWKLHSLGVVGKRQMESALMKQIAHNTGTLSTGVFYVFGCHSAAQCILWEDKLPAELLLQAIWCLSDPSKGCYSLVSMQFTFTVDNSHPVLPFKA